MQHHGHTTSDHTSTGITFVGHARTLPGLLEATET